MYSTARRQQDECRSCQYTNHWNITVCRLQIHTASKYNQLTLSTEFINLLYYNCILYFSLIYSPSFPRCFSPCLFQFCSSYSNLLSVKFIMWCKCQSFFFAICVKLNSTSCVTIKGSPPLFHYITCHLLDAFIQSDLHTFSTVANPHRSNLGWSVLPRDTTTCWLQWDSDLLPPDLKFSALTHWATASLFPLH